MANVLSLQLGALRPSAYDGRELARKLELIEDVRIGAHLGRRRASRARPWRRLDQRPCGNR